MKIKVGTRRSKLALIQTNMVIEAIKRHFTDIEFEIVEIVTSGDKFLDAELSKIGGKELFLKEIEEKLIEGGIDIAVHSMKDVPAELPKELEIKCVLEREDTRDCFISKKYSSIKELPHGGVFGTASTRKKHYVLSHRNDLQVVNFRGNVQTRLEKIENEVVDGTIMAYAGLKRLGLEHVSRGFVDDLLPAISQGAIGIEQRIGDSSMDLVLEKINHERTFIEVSAERSFLKAMGGGCTTPIAAKAALEGDKVTLIGQLYTEDGSFSSTKTENIKNIEMLGVEIANEVKKASSSTGES